MTENKKRYNSFWNHTVMNGDSREHLQSFVEHTANRLEKRFEEHYEEVSLYDENGEKNKFYRYPIPEGLSADGSEYHIYLKEGTSDHLCIILSGGGMAWNRYTASHPSTMGKLASNQPAYYYSNLRTSTEPMNIGGGITNLKRENNPFKDWSFVIITYSTGDFHIGNNDYEYKDEEGNTNVLHFHGYQNFQLSMKVAKSFFPHPEKLLFAGDSAGGFAVSALSRELVEDWYPDCHQIYVLSDAAVLQYDRWKDTIQNMWHAKPEFYEDLRTGNITLEWYRKLVMSHPKRVQCLYTGSVEDYLLSSYYNDLKNKDFSTNKEIQQDYRSHVRFMVEELQKIDPNFAFFLHNFKMPLTGGTVHTSLRRNWFYLHTPEGNSIVEWLNRAINGMVENVGMHLLND